MLFESESAETPRVSRSFLVDNKYGARVQCTLSKAAKRKFLIWEDVNVLHVSMNAINILR